MTNKTAQHPDLGATTLHAFDNFDLREVNRVLQAGLKRRKPHTRNKGVPLLQEEAHARTSTWLEVNSEKLDTLLKDAAGDVRSVALAGDWHGNETAAALAFQYAKNAGVDVLVQVGDLGVWPGHGGQQFLDLLEHLVGTYELPLLFLDGNHEDFDQLAAFPAHPSGVSAVRPGVLHLHRGTVWTWGGRRFGALGGAVSIDKGSRLPGASWWPEEEISDADVDLLLGNAGGEPLDVLLTHDTLTAAPLPTKQMFKLPHVVQIECDISRRMVKRAVTGTTPKLLVHGHYHESKRYEVAGTQVLALHMEQAPGSFAVLDLNV